MIEMDIRKLDLLPADVRLPAFSGIVACPAGSTFLGSPAVADSGAAVCTPETFQTYLVALPCPAGSEPHQEAIRY
jgi:hypothetical protein